MIERIFTRTILAEKLEDELSHIIIYSSIYQDPDKTIVFLTESPTSLIDQEIVDIVNAHVPTRVKFKIEDHVHMAYINLPIEKIDFTLHLKKNVVLAKSVYKQLNGRPDKAEYLLNGENLARIRWEFIDATGGLYQDKKLYLGYYLENGLIEEEYLIEHEIIDFTIPNQLEKSIDERVQARTAIVGEIKAVCSGALQMAFQETLEQIIARIQPFWNSTKIDRDNFIELATADWRNYIALPQTLTDYPWLDTPVDANGTTCQQYMLYRLGY